MKSIDASPDVVEIAACWEEPQYFMRRHVMVEDAVTRDWVPLDLWPAQHTVVDELMTYRQLVVLKARQIGLTWLCIAWALWNMLFRPSATVLLFSRRENESINLLDDRLKGMYSRLPQHLRAASIAVDSATHWALSNGSVARAFPTTGGDSYTASIVLVDEADLIPDLESFMASVKPTIDAGGQLILISRANKETPGSAFKRIYRAAVDGRNKSWRGVFLPWSARPDRTVEWYEKQKADVMSRNAGIIDELHEQYPTTDSEALAAKSADKRIPAAFVDRCYKPVAVTIDERTDAERKKDPTPPALPVVPGLAVYSYPTASRRYYIGADPAEGNPTSDDSAVTVVDDRDVEVASFAGKLEPSVFASYIAIVGRYYNRAPAMVERNNHGHAVLLWLRDNAADITRLIGHDGKEGWLTNSKGKALLYDNTADAFRDGETVVRTEETKNQIVSINGSTLSAPDGFNDDRSTSFALALARHVSGHSGAAQAAPGLYE